MLNVLFYYSLPRISKLLLHIVQTDNRIIYDGLCLKLCKLLKLRKQKLFNFCSNFAPLCFFHLGNESNRDVTSLFFLILICCFKLICINLFLVIKLNYFNVRVINDQKFKCQATDQFQNGA